MSEEISAFAAYHLNGKKAKKTIKNKGIKNKNNQKFATKLKVKLNANKKSKKHTQNGHADNRSKAKTSRSSSASLYAPKADGPTQQSKSQKRQSTKPKNYVQNYVWTNDKQAAANNTQDHDDTASTFSISELGESLNSEEEQAFSRLAKETAAKTRKRTADTNAAPANKFKKINTRAAAANNNKTQLDEAKNSNSKVKHITAPAIRAPSPALQRNITQLNSIDEGLRAFGWLLAPVNAKDFFAQYWEKTACMIRRKQSNYYSNLLSFESIDGMLINNHIEFTKNIDVTSYENGVRETLNPDGRAMPPVVWEHYGRGCSIRLLNPQTYIQPLYELNATLQEYFHCLVGANAYLTPPNSQGFAPHYDDIEAFVLQIEGRKRWRLYKPRKSTEVLPRYSSGNFQPDEVGEAIFDEVLEAGDLLYFPRGTIHQACTEPGFHSLHITLSVYQKQSYADLFEQMLPALLKRQIEQSVNLRRGLPLHIWQHAGIAYSDVDTTERVQLLENVKQLFVTNINNSAMFENAFDAAVDQLAKKYQREALPPNILAAERTRTIFGSKNRVNANGECECDYELNERTNVRLLRANILRLIFEDGKIRLYYYTDNSKQYCEYEPNFMEIETNEAQAIEVLIKSYPVYVGVAQLPLASDEHKVDLATGLFERGLIMLEKPFN